MIKKILTQLIPALFISGAALAQEYPVSSCQDLQNIQNDLTGNYTLTQNIDCNGFEWTPISGLFRGTLNGQNHRIDNLTLYRVVQNSSHFADWHFVALFEQLYQAKISNLTIKNATFKIEGAVKEEIAEQPSGPLNSAQWQHIGPARDATIGGMIAVLAYESQFENVTLEKINASLSTIGSFGLLSAVTKNSTFYKVSIINSDIVIDGECVAGFVVGYMMNDANHFDNNWMQDTLVSNSNLIVNAQKAYLGVLAGQSTDATLINNQLHNIVIKNNFN